MRLRRSIKAATDKMVSTDEFKPANRRKLALFFSVCAIVLGCFYYSFSLVEKWHNIWFWPFFQIEPGVLGWKLPSFMAGMIGFIAFGAPLYIRNILPWKFSPYHLIMLVTNIFLFAIIAQLVLGRQFEWGYNLTNFVLFGALILSWLGIRTMAGLAWIAVLVLAVTNLLDADIRYKEFGLPFFACTALSLVCQTNLSPGAFVSNLRDEFRQISDSPAANRLRQDVREAGAAITHATKTTIGVSSAKIIK